MVTAAPDSPVEANRKSAVSTPSRATPTKATEASARPPPLRSESLTWVRRLPPMVAACFRIQNAIQVTTPAATIIAVPSYSFPEAPSRSPATANTLAPIDPLAPGNLAAPSPHPLDGRGSHRVRLRDRRGPDAGVGLARRVERGDHGRGAGDRRRHRLRLRGRDRAPRRHSVHHRGALAFVPAP